MPELLYVPRYALFFKSKINMFFYNQESSIIEKLFIIIIIIIIIDKTDAGFNGLCIRDITLIYDVINTYNNY